PLAMVAASPNGGNPSEIPNEDSIDFELDEINVLRANRMSGLDRVEGGVRGAYGLRWAAYPPRGGFLAAQVAQGWRAHADSTYAKESGFGDNLSDYVGRVDVSPNSNLSFLNRVRLDRNDFEVRRNESTISLGPRLLRLSASYMMFERSEVADRRQYLVYTVASDLTRYWTAMGTVSHDLTEEGGPLGWQGRLIYSDECFAFVSNVRRFYTSDRDLESGYDVTFNIVFKTLGDVPFNLF
ncbi:MAG TPA: LPS assembly protein LptD, partial [Candidatus Omnitrophota bacterium]|nr:LPS assembly protein LptD [Candidatus Omnitrophota bacterium]